MGQPPVNFAAAAPPESVSQKLFQHRRLWLRLAAYRPLLIVGGFWVVLLVIALVAYGRLTATGTQSASQPRALYPHERDQLEQAQMDREVLPASPATVGPRSLSPVPETQAVTESETQPSETQSTVTIFPGWSLGLLVALCAGGCLALSQQLNTTGRKPHRKRKAAPLKLTPSQAQASPLGKQTPKPGPKRMQPYRPVPGAADFVPVPQPERGTVTVVPESHAHALDWSKDSLVNAMDVRQRRSVSSWLSS